MNLLGWAMLCPAASHLLWHGSTPRETPEYPTARELSEAHSKLLDRVEEVLFNTRGCLDVKARFREDRDAEQTMLTISIAKRVDDNKTVNKTVSLCARGRGDLIVVARARLRGEWRPIVFYVEAATRVHIAKPPQTLLKMIAVYQKYRLPTAGLIVSPEKIGYRALRPDDILQVEKLLLREKIPPGFKGHPNMCSLCELSHDCPWRGI